MGGVHPMAKRQVRYLVDGSGNRTAVVLELAEYEQLLADTEAIEEIRAYDVAAAAGEIPQHVQNDVFNMNDDNLLDLYKVHSSRYLGIMNIVYSDFRIFITFITVILGALITASLPILNPSPNASPNPLLALIPALGGIGTCVISILASKRTLKAYKVWLENVTILSKIEVQIESKLLRSSLNEKEQTLFPERFRNAHRQVAEFGADEFVKRNARKGFGRTAFMTYVILFLAGMIISISAFAYLIVRILPYLWWCVTQAFS